MIEIKLQAFLSTQFTEFVWMDTDNLPLMAPENHFDTVEYSKSHAVFWSDLNKDHPDNAIWRYLARPCNDIDWPVEAGQIVYDKRGNNGLNYAVLHISNHMMDDSEFYGQLMYGDKDTFVSGRLDLTGGALVLTHPTANRVLPPRSRLCQGAEGLCWSGRSSDLRRVVRRVVWSYQCIHSPFHPLGLEVTDTQ